MAWRQLCAGLAVVAFIAWFGRPYFESLLNGWFQFNAENRALDVMTEFESRSTGLLQKNNQAALRTLLTGLSAQFQLAGMAICASDGRLIAATAAAPPALDCNNVAVIGASVASSVMRDGAGPLLLTRFERSQAPVAQSRVLIAQRLRNIGPGTMGWRNFVIAFAGISTLTLALVIALLAWWLLRRWVTVLTGDIRSGRFFDDAWSPRFSLPILSQVRKALRDVEATQRLEIDYRENWTPQALQLVVKEQLRSEQIIVVSNRQPYSHYLDAAGQLQVQVPASGMVTALEPIMRACAGVWIAHGSGAADRQMVDHHDRLRVPPDEPVYSLRRVWLTEAEEQGYYYGFSNEGLWPLCHLAYVRPAFRARDWQVYQAVNARFAAAVASETSSPSPLVLIQDFHFALLPRLLRQLVPRATIAIFWHVPWPNPETFGVCPWKRDILTHMLAADIIGFHTLYDCQNFLATADRFLECQIDHEHTTVTSQGHVCHVAPYPISIEWPPRWLSHAPSIAAARAAVRSRYGLRDVRLGVGVERWDFTKGILERFQALELYFEQHPEQLGRLCFLQIAAPSRSTLPAYRELQRRTLAEAERINQRLATPAWRPIVLVGVHQEPDQVFEIYRAADFCMVNSLHDGMNLVAKEFVAARDDEDGVLVLSSFAGASRELVEALLVNPFDASETAAAISAAMAMPRDERRERMRMMRRTVQENNVYRWAGRMLTDAARIRQRHELNISHYR